MTPTAKPDAFGAEAKSTAPERQASRRQANRAASDARPADQMRPTAPDVTRPHPY